MTRKGNLNDIANEYMHQLQQRGHVKFTTIIEEKKKDFGNKSLIDCGPWVTGEILYRKILKIYSMAKSISHTHCLLWVFMQYTWPEHSSFVVSQKSTTQMPLLGITSTVY